MENDGLIYRIGGNRRLEGGVPDQRDSRGDTPPRFSDPGKDGSWDECVNTIWSSKSLDIEDI
jgi:hypothetical protein